MTDNDNTQAAATSAAETVKRFRSEIEFPYSDLESAVELAQTLHTRAGTSADVTELAAWMNQSATGGTFRTRVSAAKIFGLIDTGQGRVTLNQLGRDVLINSGKERTARVDAFLKAELFRAMYDQFKGNILPPAAAIERHMGQLGVSPKQTERARQTFMKSAVYAGFIDASSGRFIKPGVAGQSEDNGAAGQGRDADRGGGGNGGGPPPAIDPIIQGLLARLPKSGDIWPEGQRKLWLDLLAGSFKLIYKDEETP